LKIAAKNISRRFPASLADFNRVSIIEKRT